MASDFKLKVILNVFVILVIYSLPTKQDTETTTDVSANKPLLEAESQEEPTTDVPANKPLLEAESQEEPTTDVSANKPLLEAESQEELTTDASANKPLLEAESEEASTTTTTRNPFEDVWSPIIPFFTEKTESEEVPTTAGPEGEEEPATDVPSQEAESQDDDQAIPADDKIGETIEEVEETNSLENSVIAETVEVNDDQQDIAETVEENDDQQGNAEPVEENDDQQDIAEPVEENDDQQLDVSVDDSSKSSKKNESEALAGSDEIDLKKISDIDCWLKLDAANHFKVMNELDATFSSARRSFNNRVVETLNRNMLRALLDNRGIAYRALHNTAGDPSKIPAGLNLGGYSMLRMQDSILFFHRMKLRNNTVFRVDFFENDLLDMTVNTRLCLNDLHLVGAYERSATHKNPSILFYAPSFGEIEILLKNVFYNMEGRLRFQNKRLAIEVVDSTLILNDDILMTYLNSEDSKPMRVQKQNLGDFLARMKNDLDMWLKDYFNDYYTYFPLKYEDEDFKTYEKKRLVAYNEYANNAIKAIKQRIYELGINQVKIPKFTLFSVPNVQVKLYDGVIRGLETMYRRSIATGKRAKDIRYVDMLVGFSNLKVEYTFSVILPNGQPTLAGRLMLTADDLAAHLQIAMVKDPEAIDLKLDFIKQFKPESLAVEGPANKFIANFKHLLENHAIAIMSNTLIHNVNMLSTLTRCDPNLYTDDRPNAYSFGRPSGETNAKLFFDYINWNPGAKAAANVFDGEARFPNPSINVNIANSGYMALGDSHVNYWFGVHGAQTSTTYTHHAPYSTTRPPPTNPPTARPPPTNPPTTRPPPTNPPTTRPPTEPATTTCPPPRRLTPIRKPKKNYKWNNPYYHYITSEEESDHGCYWL